MNTDKQNTDRDPDSIEERAAALFTGGYYCAESVLLAVAEHNGRSTEGLARLMTGMCGGVSRSDGMCGALLGGVAAIGLLFGRDTPDGDKRQAYMLGHHLANRFEREFGSKMCSTVLGCDISTKQGLIQFQKEQLGSTRCLGVTCRAAELTQELIDNRTNLEHPLL